MYDLLLDICSTIWQKWQKWYRYEKSLRREKTGSVLRGRARTDFKRWFRCSESSRDRKDEAWLVSLGTHIAYALSWRSIETLTHSYALLRSSAPTYRAIATRHLLRSFNFNTLSISCARISFRWSTTFQRQILFTAGIIIINIINATTHKLFTSERRNGDKIATRSYHSYIIVIENKFHRFHD